MTLREWIVANYPGSFTKARNKGHGRVEKAIVRAYASPYVADGVCFEVVTIDIKRGGLMYRDIYQDIRHVAQRLHTTLDGQGVVTAAEEEAAR